MSSAATLRSKSAVVAAFLILLLGIWAILDQAVVSKSSLRDFSPQSVARLETEMWRSYYAKERFALFTEMAELLRTQYHFSRLRSYLGAYYAARAAVVFQRGHERREYEKALPPLRRFYRMIGASSDSPFDEDEAARLELEWWIVHRERASHAPGDLADALAALQAIIYKIPPDKCKAHAAARAAAMILRDEDAAKAHAPAQADWVRIEALLNDSWTSLWRAVH
jgi:hypothetical protein